LGLDANYVGEPGADPAIPAARWAEVTGAYFAWESEAAKLALALVLAGGAAGLWEPRRTDMPNAPSVSEDR
jgi:hypothetical protein